MINNEWMDIREMSTPALTPMKRGVLIELSLSPYDVPEAMRGFYDKKTKRFVIEFRYIDDEPSQIVESSEHASFSVGRHTKRIQAIRLDVDAMKVNRVMLKLEREAEQAISKLSSIESHGAAPLANYEIMRSLIADKWKELVPSFGESAAIAL